MAKKAEDGQLEVKSVVTPMGRLSYPYVFKRNPKSEIKDKATKEVTGYNYTCQIIWGPDKDLTKLKAEAMKAHKNMWHGKRPKLKWPAIRDHTHRTSDDTEGFDETTLHISAKADRWNPVEQVLDRENEPVGEGHPGGIYGGCYGRLLVRPYAFDNEYGKGISWTLQGVQFVKDGEPFGEIVDAKSALQECPLDDDDLDDSDDDGDVMDSLEDEEGDDGMSAEDRALLKELGG